MVAFERLEEIGGTERMLRDTVDELAEEFDEEYMLRCREEDRQPEELMAAMTDLGFSGMNIPEEYGGEGMSMREMAILTERLNYHGLNSPYLLVSSTMAPIPIKKNGSEELKERILPKLASGEIRFCFGATEPEAGTNTVRIQTEARRDGDEYVINGQKYFISGVGNADYIQLIVRTTPYRDVKDENPYHGVSILLVPTDLPGLEYESLNLRMPGATEQYSVYLDDVRVPVENRVGEEDEGFSYMFDAMNPERIFFAAQSVGTGTRFIEKAVDHANERVVFDDPIGAYQSVQHPLAEAKIELELVWLATMRAADAFDSEAGSVGAYSNIIKYACSRAQWNAIDAAAQTFGGRAFMPETGLIDAMQGARLARIAPINNEMILNYVAERVLGLPRSY